MMNGKKNAAAVYHRALYYFSLKQYNETSNNIRSLFNL